jgi:hypothetical protein
MDNHELINILQERVVEIYKKEELIPLRGKNDDYKINSRNILIWFHDVTNKNAVKYDLHMEYFNLQNDLLICSDEMIYFTAHLFLYLPYINNPLNEAHMFAGSEMFPNYQNIEAKRYNMFTDVVSQKTYNYWDRIGDLIASFFKDKIKPNQIYFTTAMDLIPEQFHSNSNYLWLLNFKNTEYKELNETRKQVVHYTTTDTNYRYSHLQIPTDKEAMIALQAKRTSLPEYYKKQIQLTLEGFKKTMQLLEEFNDVLFPND